MNGDNPSSATLERRARAAEAAIVDLARATARPYPYRFEIRRAVPSGTAGDGR